MIDWGSLDCSSSGRSPAYAHGVASTAPGFTITSILYLDPVSNFIVLFLTKSRPINFKKYRPVVWLYFQRNSDFNQLRDFTHCS
uniref:Uncharacterized protein n=1 Tax=Anguilla anguilla TaxID=7936 RepID=A0A0E9SSW0_ANGAN